MSTPSKRVNSPFSDDGAVWIVLQYGALRSLTAVRRKFGTHFQRRNNVPSKMAFKRLVDRFDRRQIRCAAPRRCARCGTSARGPKPVSEGKATQWKIREEHPSACGVYINPNVLLFYFSINSYYMCNTYVLRYSCFKSNVHCEKTLYV